MTSAAASRSRPPVRARARSSLGQRLAFLMLPLLLAPTLAIGGAGYLRSRAILKQQASAQLTSTAQIKLRPLLERTEELELRLSLAAQNQDLRSAVSELVASDIGAPPPAAALETVRTHLAELEANETQRQFTRLIVVRAADSRVLASSDQVWEGDTFPAWESLRLPADDTATRPAFDNVMFGPGELTFVTASPVREPETGERSAHLVGVNSGLQVGAMLREMVSVWELRGFHIVEKGETFVALAPDILLEMASGAMLPTAERVVNHPVFGAVVQDPSGTLEYTGAGDVPMLAAYEWMPDWGMGAVVQLPQSEVLADLNQLAPFIAAVVVAASLVTIVAVAFTTNRAVRPLGRLVDFSQRISRGDWRYRVPEDRDDEVGLLASAFNRMAHDLSQMYQSLEQQVEERTRQVRTASDVARAITSTVSLEELLRRAVELIRERFGYDHVSIFLLDEHNRFAVLRESTGEVGARLKALGHRLEVGSNSMIGWVTANNQTRLASNVGADPVHMKNELLPDTQSEAAVPLQVTGRVLGALDVQSRHPDAFSEEDLEILQTLADQLSAAILNARLAERSAQAAERSRALSQITLDLAAQPGLNAVLQATARAVHKVLGSPEVVVSVTQPAEGGTPFFAPLPDEGVAPPLRRP